MSDIREQRPDPQGGVLSDEKAAPVRRLTSEALSEALEPT